jgi:kynurenine formamidase
MGRGLRELRSIRVIDLSVPISPNTAEPEPPQIRYIDHHRAAHDLAVVATHLLKAQGGVDGTAPTLSSAMFPDEMGLANEKIELDAHSGTHMDAPWHFGPLSGNIPSKTIDQIPLEWCMGPGVILDLRHKRPGDTITPEDLKLALENIHYTLEPGDVVLLMTGADKHFKQKDYFSAHPGMGREATLWLLDQGVRLIGTDGWGFDRPAGAMLRDYLKTGDQSALLPAHMVGREREYCHIEKLANLDQVPVPHGFWVSCLPVKIERGSAGWVRAVAFVAGDES